MKDYLERFKQRMKISNTADDDSIIEDILVPSRDDIFSLVGEFDLATYSQGLELIFNRARYAYNGQLEFFYDNFQQRIMDISLDLLGGEPDGDKPEV